MVLEPVEALLIGSCGGVQETQKVTESVGLPCSLTSASPVVNAAAVNVLDDLLDGEGSNLEHHMTSYG